MVVVEINQEDPEAELTCGRVILLITTNYDPCKRLKILSRILLNEGN